MFRYTHLGPGQVGDHLETLYESRWSHSVLVRLKAVVEISLASCFRFVVEKEEEEEEEEERETVVWVHSSVCWKLDLHALKAWNMRILHSRDLTIQLVW